MGERKQIVVFPVGTLDAKTKEHLSKNGYLGIEAPDPSKVVTVLPTAALTSHASADQIVHAMMVALSENGQRQQSFGAELLNILRSAP